MTEYMPLIGKIIETHFLMTSPTSSNKKINVLVIAEAANPDWTSVPLLGWLHTLALSKVCNVHLVTQVRNKEAIEQQGWKEGIEFSTIDSEKLNAPIAKGTRYIRQRFGGAWTIDTAFMSMMYPYFEYLCWKKFKHDLTAGKFDIVHRITPVSPTSPSLLAKHLSKLNIPFVVGPLNGGVKWPPQFRNILHKENEWLNYLRSAHKLLPGYNSMRKYASVLLAGSLATKEQLPTKYKDKVLYVPENAIDPSRFSLKNTSTYDAPIKAAFVGRLVPYKGVDMAIEAMESLLKRGKIRFDIYGTGPQSEHIKKIVQEKALGEFVTLHGFVPNTEIQKQWVKADILVFPSIREFGGGAVLESMALGVVPVIADYAGPSELVTDKTGFKIPIADRDTLIRSFKETLEKICEDPSQLADMRQAGIERVNQYFTWEKKVEKDIQVYNWLLGHSGKPDFQEPVE